MFSRKKTQRFERIPLTFAAAQRIVSQKRLWTASLSYVAAVMFLVCSLSIVSSPPPRCSAGTRANYFLFSRSHSQYTNMNTTNRYHHVDGILPYKPPPWRTGRSTRILTTLLAVISLFSVFISAPARRNVSSLSPSPIASPHPALRHLLRVLSFLPSLFLPENSLLPHLPITFSSPHVPPLRATPSPSLPSTTPTSAASSHGPYPPFLPSTASPYQFLLRLAHTPRHYSTP